MKFDANRLLSTALTIAACAMAVALVRREFFPGANANLARGMNKAPQFEKDWKSIAAAGVLIGRADAPVQLVEFSEMECPFCRRFHQGALRAAREKFGDRLAVSFVHFPIPGHRFAVPAARAAECAGEQGKFSEFVELVFAKQDSLGLKAWTSFASDAGVDDSVKFATCTKISSPVARIDSGVAVGERFEVLGTPTVFINGWRLSSAPSDTALAGMIDNVLSGRPPVGTKK